MNKLSIFALSLALGASIFVLPQNAEACGGYARVVVETPEQKVNAAVTQHFRDNRIGQIQEITNYDLGTDRGTVLVRFLRNGHSVTRRYVVRSNAAQISSSSLLAQWRVVGSARA